MIKLKLWLGVSAVLLAACGTTTAASVATTTSSASGGTTSTSKAPSTSTTVGAAHVGATEIVNDGSGHSYSVQVVSVVDPATPADQFNTPSAGKRLVAVNLTLTNKSNAIIQDDADSTTTVIGSDNQTYQSSIDSVTGCTDFNSGQFTLTAGGTSSGCVVFSIPLAVKVAKVEFQPTSFTSTVVATWLVP